ncbi:MAG: hypothetical protein KAW42_06545 [Candidatus Atribacteria bacterium]|nr:hypothetical protein [Candidatus Atribacteria bacterium]MCK4309615.1 hypothetical protein [Candidatus Atribacteria bacterium]
MINKYHYLEYRRVIGHQVKWIIYSAHKFLGYIGFVDAMLKLI